MGKLLQTIEMSPLCPIYSSFQLQTKWVPVSPISGIRAQLPVQKRVGRGDKTETNTSNSWQDSFPMMPQGERVEDGICPERVEGPDPAFRKASNQHWSAILPGLLSYYTQSIMLIRRV